MFVTSSMRLLHDPRNGPSRNCSFVAYLHRFAAVKELRTLRPDVNKFKVAHASSQLGLPTQRNGKLHG